MFYASLFHVSPKARTPSTITKLADDARISNETHVCNRNIVTKLRKLAINPLFSGAFSIDFASIGYTDSESAKMFGFQGVIREKFQPTYLLYYHCVMKLLELF